MKILVTGADGQLGMELCRTASTRGHTAQAATRERLDITDEARVRRAVDDLQPDVVINAAAWTAVDAAEDCEAEAARVNADGPMHLAGACSARQIPLVHFSTDYVFDGDKPGEYLESDPTGPVNAYGRGKLAGEERVRQANDRHLVLRTSWVFSQWGHNFVKTMLKLGRERDRIAVVADQRGKPTCAAELARVAVLLVEERTPRWGTYHVAQPADASWHEFAQAIFEEAGRQGADLRVRHVDPVPASEFETAAKRPANSVLNCDRVESTFGIELLPWRESLVEVIRKLKDDGFFS